MNPEDRIRAYLSTHQTGLQFSTVDQAVSQVKFNLFFGMSPLKDEEIRKIVVSWATIYCVGMLIGPQAASPPANPNAQSPGDPPNKSEMLDSVKKALSVVVEGVTLGPKGTNIVIKVTGVTANLKRGDKEISLGLSPGGTLDLKARSGPFNFEGTLATDKWEISLSFPRDSFIPDMSKLGKVFSEGEKSVRNLAVAASKVGSVDDARKMSALVKPDIAAVQEAADALSAISDHPKGGGYSFGVKIGSPDPLPGQQGMPGGYQGTIVFTYTF